MDQFKSWTPKKYNFLTADQQLTARVHRLYRTLLGQSPIFFLRRRFAIFAPCLPSAVRVLFGNREIVRFLRADLAAFLMLRRAAVRCRLLAMVILLDA